MRRRTVERMASRGCMPGSVPQAGCMPDFPVLRLAAWLCLAIQGLPRRAFSASDTSARPSAAMSEDKTTSTHTHTPPPARLATGVRGYIPHYSPHSAFPRRNHHHGTTHTHTHTFAGLALCHVLCTRRPLSADPRTRGFTPSQRPRRARVQRPRAIILVHIFPPSVLHTPARATTSQT